MIDDDYELASAYSDGELDPAQRAAVEQDPAVFALVAEITALRATLADQLPATLDPANAPPPELRAQHLAAAGAAFDEAPAVTATPSPQVPAPVHHPAQYTNNAPYTNTAPYTNNAPYNNAEPATAPIIDLRNKRRYRLLTLAAGVVVVAGVGAAALNGLARSSSDSAGTEAGELATSNNDELEPADVSAEEAVAADGEIEQPETGTPEAAKQPSEDEAADDAENAEAAAQGTSAFALTAGVEPSHFFPADTTLDVIFDTVTKDNEAAIEAVCRPDLLPPGVNTSSYIVDRDGERLQVLVGVHRIATNVILVDGECQPIDELERPTD